MRWSGGAGDIPLPSQATMPRSSAWTRSLPTPPCEPPIPKGPTVVRTGSASALGPWTATRSTAPKPGSRRPGGGQPADPEMRTTPAKPGSFEGGGGASSGLGRHVLGGSILDDRVGRQVKLLLELLQRPEAEHSHRLLARPEEGDRRDAHDAERLREARVRIDVDLDH